LFENSTVRRTRGETSGVFKRGDGTIAPTPKIFRPRQFLYK
jgi:hypothetical protein